LRELSGTSNIAWTDGKLSRYFVWLVSIVVTALAAMVSAVLARG
jgi:hypothetical protein